MIETALIQTFSSARISNAGVVYMDAILATCMPSKRYS